MGRKTIILREDQFNEICGTNTAYLDNNNDYAEDGTVTTKAAGSVSDSNGEKEYSKPVTGKEWGHELAPETLFALLFRNGGHGLWGHWGSGLRARELTEEITPADDNAFEEHWNEFEDWVESYDQSDYPTSYTPKMIARHFFEYGIELARTSLNESNSELEGRAWKLDLDNDGMDKTYSYTDLTTKKTELKKKLIDLVQQNAPEEMINKVKAKYAAICRVLGRETGAIKGRKTAMKNLGFNNQFQKPGGSKDSVNGKAHSKKVKDPNVGTGYITYAE